MRSSEAVDRRTELPRKTVPKGSGVRAKTSRINRNASVRKSSAKKAGFRSNFELGVARSLANKKVPYEYESVKLTYVPKPRTYTPDFYLPNRRCLSK